MTIGRSLGSAFGSLARRLDRVNTLAVPFLDEEDTEDDYALLPPPKPLKSLQLMGIAFFAVSGSAYGIEESVAAGGPFLALLALLLAPVLWSAPMLMVASELSVAMPQSGGYIVWVNSAFGALPSMLNGMSNLLCNVLDCALYPVLLTDYLQRALPALRPSAAGAAAGATDGAAAEAASLPLEMLWVVLRLALVAVAAGLNVAGVNLVGHAAGGFMLLVSLPFVALTVGAVASPDFAPATLLDTSAALWPEDAAGWYFLGTLVLWNTCGYDSAGMLAAEVAAPRATFPRALWGALALTTALYVVPLAACAAASSDWHEWREGQFARLAADFGGGGLAVLVEAGAVVSLVAVLCTLMCTTSRALAAMAQLRMLPARLAQLHPTLGTPVAAVLANALMVGLATSALRFELLMELSMSLQLLEPYTRTQRPAKALTPTLTPTRTQRPARILTRTLSPTLTLTLTLTRFFYSLNVLMQLAAALRLRASHPQLPRPEHTLPPVGFVPPALLALLVLGFAPTQHWVAAALLLCATLGVYSALTLCCKGRRAVLRRGGRGGEGGRGRSPGRTLLSAAAADEAEAEDAESDAQFDARLQREMRRVSNSCTVGGGTSHTQLHGSGGEGGGVEMGESSWWPRPLPQAYARATLPAEPEPEERISAAEIVSAFEVDDGADDGRASPSDDQLASDGRSELPPMGDPLGPLRAPSAPAAAPNPGRRFPSPPQRHSVQTMRVLGGGAAVPGGEVQVACALADSLFAEGRGESV